MICFVNSFYKVTNLLVSAASGFICAALTGDRLRELEIPMMVADNQDPHKTAYTVTVDYKHGEGLASFTCIHLLTHPEFRGHCISLLCFANPTSH